MAVALLRQMMKADRSLALSGEQTTILYRYDGPPTESNQTIYRDSNNGYRCVYHSPPNLDGEVIVASHGMTWRFVPRTKKLISSPGSVRRFMPRIEPALQALRNGAAQAEVIGTDTVAGRPASVVLISGSGPESSGSIKLWIDTGTGAQLRVDVYDAAGAPQSSSYFTSVTYNPVFPPGAFDQPTVPGDTRILNQGEEARSVTLPSDEQAGFHVLKPAFVPAGYVFKSASLFLFQGRSAVHLQYTSALSILSIFERPYDTDVAGRVNETRSPRAGTVIMTARGIEFVAIGTLTDEQLIHVLNSMR